MPVDGRSIRLGHCYVTEESEARKVVAIDNSAVTYVVRDHDRLTFPTWDRRRRKTTNRKDFSGEVTREVPCDWEGG
jgi:hypothetical protein